MKQMERDLTEQSSIEYDKWIYRVKIAL